MFLNLTCSIFPLLSRFRIKPDKIKIGKYQFNIPIRKKIFLKIQKPLKFTLVFNSQTVAHFGFIKTAPEVRIYQAWGSFNHKLHSISDNCTWASKW